MSVLVRSKRGEKIRRRREGYRSGSAAETQAPHAMPDAGAAPQPATKVRPPAAVAGGEVRREQGRCSGKPLTNDLAVYHCQCGYVFRAPVSTSVGCPNCGGTQAW